MADDLWSFRPDPALAQKVLQAMEATGLTRTTILNRFIEQGDVATLLDHAEDDQRLLWEIYDRLVRLLRRRERP